MVSDSIFADNYLGVDIDRTDGVVFRDSVIIGESKSYRELKARQEGVEDVCRNTRVMGIEMHTWSLHSVEYGGAVIENIVLSGFDDHGVCNPVSIRVDDHNEKEGQFELQSTFRNIRFEDGVESILFCFAERAGISTVHYVDLDGSLSPPGAVLPVGASTIMSNSPEMKRFVDPSKCSTNENGCFTYCRDTCFRSVRYETLGTEMDGYALKACLTNDSSNCSIFRGAQRNPGDPRTFIAHLPVGNSYNLVFLDSSGRGVMPTADFFEVNQHNMCPDESGSFSVQLVASLP